MMQRVPEARAIIEKNHQSLFIEELNDFINKVRIFGFHFFGLFLQSLEIFLLYTYIHY